MRENNRYSARVTGVSPDLTFTVEIISRMRQITESLRVFHESKFTSGEVQEAAPSINELKSFAKEKLPEYMVLPSKTSLGGEP